MAAAGTKEDEPPFPNQALSFGPTVDTKGNILEYDEPAKPDEFAVHPPGAALTGSARGGNGGGGRYLVLAVHGSGQGHLKGVALDFGTLLAWFGSCHLEQDPGSLWQSNPTRDQVLLRITRFLHHDAALHVLCWLGHGAEATGDWMVADGTISFREIVDLCKNCMHQAGLFSVFVFFCCLVMLDAL
jgi:hypothetical protein